MKGNLQNTCKIPDTRLVLAYSLKAGGIALHLANKESAQKVLQFRWPETAFNNSGSQLHCHTPSNHHKVILKNIDPSLSEKEVQDLVEGFLSEKIQVKRFYYRDTGKRLPVVKIRGSETACHKLLTRSFTIQGKEVQVSKFLSVHHREIPCYNCQEGGHIARSCPGLLPVE